MKRKSCALKLHRETLKALDSRTLEPAVAGVTGPKACEWSGYQTCATCGATCGTNLC
ncbi:MAG: hypothetical protein ABJC13_18305 [Acidobacteriota bacterium]